MLMTDGYTTLKTVISTRAKVNLRRTFVRNRKNRKNFGELRGLALDRVLST